MVYEDVDSEDYKLNQLRLRASGREALRAEWKTCMPENDPTPKISYTQELMMYIPPAPGTIPTHHRMKKGEFKEFMEKAVRLNVNLKSTSH
mmetsp:Transcript_18475/g.31053  ORF Transcript_18475/g.31053 Transcript_18475/m.31053 type:complete len:91 (-) Transcript_18475:262-534(-)|eukprot:CAMPEP_0198210326 /NCGR_PEP_ID=MMETSP1445-20131203/20036_1 /TAXON_ID=36898 /ORGANISM="Pyramimonas sp., Strain CCMP2087" /LENGTH=90 /DNA_ID=CAMNT_0043884361 /DNA_START=228 /DNA_END=500 /DNA_ORIENTATION=-